MRFAILVTTGLLSLSACGSPPSGSGDGATGPAAGQPTETSESKFNATRKDFEARGLKWPLTVEQGNVGCTKDAVWFKDEGGQKYGVNGRANSRPTKYIAIEPIWSVDEKQEALLKEAGIPSNPPLRISIGDLIDEGLKLC